MKNKLIRLKLMEHDLTQYDLSRLLGISETTLYRRLRDELPEEKQKEIIQLIEQSGGEEDDTHL